LGEEVAVTSSACNREARRAGKREYSSSPEKMKEGEEHPLLYPERITATWGRKRKKRKTGHFVSGGETRGRSFLRADIGEGGVGRTRPEEVRGERKGKKTPLLSLRQADRGKKKHSASHSMRWRRENYEECCADRQGRKKKEKKGEHQHSSTKGKGGKKNLIHSSLLATKEGQNPRSTT